VPETEKWKQQIRATVFASLSTLTDIAKKHLPNEIIFILLPRNCMPMIFEQQPRESNKAFAAFKTYLDMGPERSLEAVSQKLTKSSRLLKRWSVKFDWQGRVKARDVHFAELERQAIERLACEKAVEWWRLQEPAKRQAWMEGEEAIRDVQEARRRWWASGRVVGFEGMARMLDLGIKLKQFANGMPSEVKEVHQHVTGTVSVEWAQAIRKAYGLPDDAPIVEVEPLVPPAKLEAAKEGTKP